MKAQFPAILISLAVLLPQGQAEQPPVERVAVLADKRIHESSGLVRSHRHPGIFWTHNDSGGEPCLFAINLKGETVAKVRIPKAANFDWEDIAQGLDDHNQPRLFIGDIGDNFKLRASLQIYSIPEPDLPTDAQKEIESAEPEIWHVSYPGKRYNSECLLRHPGTGVLYLVTKEENGHSKVFQVPVPQAEGQAMKLEEVASLEFPPKVRAGKRPSMASQVTAGDFSADGKRLVIATYSYFYEWRLAAGERLSEALRRPATLIEPPLTSQMESVCYDEDNVSLWFTSEQLPSPLYRLSRP